MTTFLEYVSIVIAVAVPVGGMALVFWNSTNVRIKVLEVEVGILKNEKAEIKEQYKNILIKLEMQAEAINGLRLELAEKKDRD